jgi:hypothetical protein
MLMAKDVFVYPSTEALGIDTGGKFGPAFLSARMLIELRYFDYLKKGLGVEAYARIVPTIL